MATRFPAVLILAGTLTLVSTASLAAQTPVVAGSRVRITAPALGLDRSAALVREASDAALVVELTRSANEITTAHIARADIQRLEVLVGERRHVLRNFGIGLLTGATFGGVIGFASGDDESCECFFSLQFTKEDKALMAGTVFGAAGGIVGALTGLARTEVWSDADGRTLSLAPAVSRAEGGVRVGFSARLR